MTEVPLSGGRTTTGVVRIGDTVHRPLGQNSDFVHEILSRLTKRRFPYSPEFLGIDAKGREVLTYVEGDVPLNLGEFSLAQIERAGHILSGLHSMTSEFEDLRGSKEVICHGDSSPCNYVLRSDVPVCLIDFDAAFPGPQKLDYGYGAWLWSNLGSSDRDLETAASQLRAYMTGYGQAPESCLDAISAAQIWQLKRLHSSEPQWMRAAMEWTLSCQRWFQQNESELRRRLTLN